MVNFLKVIPMLRPTLVIPALLRLIDALKPDIIIQRQQADRFLPQRLEYIGVYHFQLFQMEGVGHDRFILVVIALSSLMIRRRNGIDQMTGLKCKRSKTTFSQAEAGKGGNAGDLLFFMVALCSLSVSHYLDDPWLV